VEPALTVNAIALARGWEDKVISPLRAARRALGDPTDGIDDNLRQDLRDRMRGAELDAERALLDALEAQSPAPSGAAGDTERRLAALMKRWNGAKAATPLRALAAGLR
jgi:hypothetical protein